MRSRLGAPGHLCRGKVEIRDHRGLTLPLALHARCPQWDPTPICRLRREARTSDWRRPRGLHGIYRRPESSPDAPFYSFSLRYRRM